jgi:hypothetical protein
LIFCEAKTTVIGPVRLLGVAYSYAQIERAIVQRNNPRSSQRDSSPNNSDPGRRRFGDVADQYLHPDGRGYKKLTQYRGVRGFVDLDLASVRGDRSYSGTQDPAVALKKGRSGK